jgi:hypothetical protein
MTVCLLGGWHEISARRVIVAVLLNELTALGKPLVNPDALAVGKYSNLFGLAIIPPRSKGTVIFPSSQMRLVYQHTSQGPEPRLTVRLAIHVLRFANAVAFTVTSFAELNFWHAPHIAA